MANKEVLESRITVERCDTPVSRVYRIGNQLRFKLQFWFGCITPVAYTSLLKIKSLRVVLLKILKVESRISLNTLLI
jgi:hypothetical protein